MEKQEMIDELNAKYEMSRKRGFTAGCMFVVTAGLFTILGVILNNSNVFYGVWMQLIAGITLIANNLE